MFSFEQVLTYFREFDRFIEPTEHHSLIVWQCYDIDFVSGRFEGHCTYRLSARHPDSNEAGNIVFSGDCPFGVHAAWSEAGVPIELFSRKVADKNYEFSAPLTPASSRNAWRSVYLYAQMASNDEWFDHPHHRQSLKIGETQTHRWGRETGRGVAFAERFILPRATEQLKTSLLPESQTTGCELIRTRDEPREVLTFLANNPQSQTVSPFRWKVEYVVVPAKALTRAEGQ